MEEVHFQKMAFRYSGSTVLGLLRTKIEAKIAPRWAQDGPRWAQDGAKMGQDGPRMDSVGQVGSTWGRSWPDILQKLQEAWKMAVGQWCGRSKMGFKMDQDEREGSISRP